MKPDDLKELLQVTAKKAAKELFKEILDVYKGVDYYSFLFDGLQALADEQYGIRIMQSENVVIVEIDE